MKVIHIYGASGSGTTTLGKAICEKYGYKLMDTDDYYWLPTDPPYTSKREPSERIALMKKDMEGCRGVVISGSLCGWGDVLIPIFHLAIRMVTSTPVRLARLQAREFKNFGDRICENGDMYEDHIAFLKWAAEYDTGDINMRSKAMHNQWSSMLPCHQVVLNGEKDVTFNLEILHKYLD